MLPKKPDETGEGFGLRFGSRTRLIEYATSSAVIGRSTLPSSFTKLTPLWSLNVYDLPSAEMVGMPSDRSGTSLVPLSYAISGSNMSRSAGHEVTS